MTDDEFLAAFEAAAIPRPEWTHAAHIRMAWLYLTRFSQAEALERIRLGIQKLNTQNGVFDGYHETITVAFVRLISARLLHGETAVAFRSRNPDLFECSLAPLLKYYTRERLFSPESRARFVEPDLEHLPSFVSGSVCPRVNSLSAD
jgi:hypothetical protein